MPCATVGQGKENLDQDCGFFTTAPAIDVTKTCDPADYGQPIPFRGTVTNMGDVELINVECKDAPSGKVVLTQASLAAGASANYSDSYLPPGDVTSSTDTVTCTGTDAVRGGTVSDSASATCPK